MPKPFTPTDSKILAKLASEGTIAANEQGISPQHTDFSHFEFPELTGEKVGDEVIVVMRGYVTKVTGKKVPKGDFGTPNNTEVRFSRASLVHGRVHGGGSPRSGTKKKMEDILGK